MSKYMIKKEHAREIAINWQINLDLDKHGWSLEYLNDWRARFERMGRKYGLIREFRENGII